MTAAVRSYQLSIAAVGLLLSLIQAILPKGAAKKTAVLAGSLLLILTVLSPLAQLDYDNIARSISRIQMDTETMRTGIEVGNRELMAKIIKQNCEAYILDKAEEMGLPLTVEITVSGGADYPYPTAVTIRGVASAAQRQALTRYIEENLGIPEAQQQWK